jgi:hypothetical protein
MRSVARAGSGLQASSLMLGADIGDLDDGKEVDVHFSGGGFDRTLKGVVRQPTSEKGLSGVVLEVDNDDPLWRALTEGRDWTMGCLVFSRRRFRPMAARTPSSNSCRPARAAPKPWRLTEMMPQTGPLQVTQ